MSRSRIRGPETRTAPMRGTQRRRRSSTRSSSRPDRSGRKGSLEDFGGRFEERVTPNERTPGAGRTSLARSYISQTSAHCKCSSQHRILRPSCLFGAGGLPGRHEVGGEHHSTPRRDGMVATGRWRDPGDELRAEAKPALELAAAFLSSADARAPGPAGLDWLASPLGEIRSDPGIHRTQRFTAIGESRYDSGADRVPGRRVYAAQHASDSTADDRSEGSEDGMKTTLGAGGLASARIARGPFARRAGR